MSTSFSPPSSSSLTFASSRPKIPCYFNPTTCQYQRFSIPEKIVYYIAKNCTNAETFKKLVETCKYFFKVNPVIVVQQLSCSIEGKWYVYDQVDGKYRIEFKYDQPKSFKIWITQKFYCFYVDASKVIPWIYKNDATVVQLPSPSLKLEDFLFIAGNAKKLFMWNQIVKYENGKTVQLEDIVKNVPKLKSLTFISKDGSDVNSNTARKLMEIKHFKNISRLQLHNMSEELDIKEMFKFIVENKHIKVDLYYRRGNSDAFKELIQQYSNLLGSEEGNDSIIQYDRINTVQE